MDIDATKAPRTHATWKKAYDAQELAKLMVELSVQLEVELNVATVNEVFAENEVHILEKELKQAQDCIKRLEEWKESAMAVEREWNPNSLSKMLGGQLGESQRKVIQREVPKLLTRIKRLEEAGNQMELVLISFQIFSDFRKSDSIRASLNWTKTKEAKL
jgi:hypothetical protein